MSTTSELTSSTNARPRRRYSNRRYFLAGLAAFALTLALFYIEENVRGRAAWEATKRELEAKGFIMDWNALIPAPVPDDQNIFKAPRMQEWFVGKGDTEFTRRLSAIRDGLPKTPAVAVAYLIVVPPGANPAAIRLDDTTAATKRIEDAVGARSPSVLQSTEFLSQRAGQINPVTIYVESATNLTIKSFAALIPKEARAANTGSNPTWTPPFRVDLDGSNQFKLTLQDWLTATDFLAGTEASETNFDLIRQALTRPYSVMPGDYTKPSERPIPNFVGLRAAAQMLADRAACFLLTGRPEMALDELSLMRGLCRMCKCTPSSNSTTLVAAMIDVALTRLYADTVKEGIRLQAWRESQLSGFEHEMEPIQLRPLARAGFAAGELPGVCRSVEITPQGRLAALYSTNFYKAPDYSWMSLLPRGWVYQNMSFYAREMDDKLSSIPPDSQLIDPEKIDQSMKRLDDIIGHGHSLFRYVAGVGIPNFTRAFQVTAQNQTAVNQTRIVCALERFRMEHHEYPETLEALVPQFIQSIPVDVIGGQPPHYRRTNDGHFQLYSIGWSQKDLGGKVILDNQQRDFQGDWVW